MIGEKLQIDELVIGEECSQQVAHLHVYIAFAESRVGNLVG